MRIPRGSNWSFTAFIIRTLSWKLILADNGFLLGSLKDLGLLARNAERNRVRWIEAGDNRVLVSDVIRDDQVILNIQKRGVAPEWRMILLRVEQNAVARGNRVRLAGEMRDVGNALLLVANEIVQHVDVFGLSLFHQALRSVEIHAGIVHVEVVVAVPPAPGLGGHRIQTLERHRQRSIVGSIYKGTVTNVLPGMQAAFVDLGLSKDAFLYAGDYTPNLGEYVRTLAAALR